MKVLFKYDRDLKNKEVIHDVNGYEYHLVNERHEPQNNNTLYRYYTYKRLHDGNSYTIQYHDSLENSRKSDYCQYYLNKDSGCYVIPGYRFKEVSTIEYDDIERERVNHENGIFQIR